VSNAVLGLLSTINQPTSYYVDFPRIKDIKEGEVAHSFYTAASKIRMRSFFVISPRYIPKLHLGEKLNS
jgi:hypothetical protein